MLSLTKQNILLANGIGIAQLGFGTYKITEYEVAKQAIDSAIEHGYRAFDTAQLYGNEKILGRVFQENPLKRDELFITTKIANDKQGYDTTLTAFEQSLTDLQTDYVDLFLMHWPLKTTFFQTWKAIERIYEEKRARAIGVCNFHQTHFELLSTQANIKPMVNQIEIHPYLIQQSLTDYLRHEDIAIQAWSPLARSSVNEDPRLIKLAKKYQRSPAQIVLRWHIQQGYIVIPKSATPARIIENSLIDDFQLTADDMNLINSLDEGFRTGPDPDVVFEKDGF
ncbi:aldo/keto reductase [Utexia brackfieldae]|uniref:aldo/keto reductase n=1 Tax=Utexia brackfieldae TaxID=3074108 RepID=UPI00370D715C